MGELNPTQRVVDIIKKIDQHLYQLPSIQRPFVWDEDQILKLIDSLICSYPIGAIMVWKPAEKIRCRSFMDTYDPGDHSPFMACESAGGRRIRPQSYGSYVK